MKKFLMVLISICFLATSSVAFADGNRFGVQFGSGMDFGGIYYGEDYAWAAGAKIGYSKLDMTWLDDTLSSEQDSVSFSIFARKNFKIKNNIYLGIGATIGLEEGEAVVEGVGSADFDSWNVAPYFLIDYHLSKHFIINAGASIVSFKFDDYTANDIDILEKDTVDVMEPFVVLTYMF